MIPIPRDLMTLAQWEALPEDNSANYELQEGVLIAFPKSPRDHQRAVMRIAGAVEPQLPLDWEVVYAFEVIVCATDPATVRVPDLVVVPGDGPRARVAAPDVILAVEVIAAGTRNVDTHLEAFEYAEAGIPHYWLVDLEPPAPSITVFGLGAPGDGYVESQTATGELVVTEPFPLRVDIPALLARRGT